VGNAAAVMAGRRERLLRTAFLAGALTDALAVVPMLSPSLARLLWGFEDTGSAYRFAMGYAASLMVGWTVLLLWAHRRPTERSFVAALTVVVIYGLAATEVAAVVSRHIDAWRMVPTWIIQAGLLGLLASAYHYPWPRRAPA
jgi:uncharacterized membrane protein